MTRQSYTPARLDKLKENRQACNIPKNKSLEPYKHAALIVSRKGGGAIIGYGNNKYSAIGSIHAEANAFENATNYLRTHKTRNLNTYKARMQVDLIVMRTTGGNSRPCFHCITEQIVNNPYFNVRSILYSDVNAEGGYVKTNKSTLFEEREAHYSGFNAQRLNIDTMVTKNSTDGTCGCHGGDCDDEMCDDDNESESAKEALRCQQHKRKL